MSHEESNFRFIVYTLNIDLGVDHVSTAATSEVETLVLSILVKLIYDDVGDINLRIA